MVPWINSPSQGWCRSWRLWWKACRHLRKDEKKIFPLKKSNFPEMESLRWECKSLPLPVEFVGLCFFDEGIKQLWRSWTSFVHKNRSPFGTRLWPIPWLLTTFVLSWSSDGVIRSNGMSGRETSGKSDLAFKLSLCRTFLYVLFSWSSNSTFSTPDFGESSNKLPYLQGISLEKSCFARLLSYFFRLSFSARQMDLIRLEFAP